MLRKVLDLCNKKANMTLRQAGCQGPGVFGSTREDFGLHEFGYSVLGFHGKGLHHRRILALFILTHLLLSMPGAEGWDMVTDLLGPPAPSLKHYWALEMPNQGD